MPRSLRLGSVFTSLLATLLATVAAATSAPVARADHGCSDERVSLPDGPGSIGGVGDNVELDANMGSMSTQVSIELPEGFEEATPSLALQYNSSAGSGEVGFGWSFPLPSIERMRMRGLPVYDESDAIVADGGRELVRTGTLGGSVVYRARTEGSFVRYRWHASAGGTAGYWTAERPDGTTAYFGADETGTPVRAARVQTTAGEVYRWHLVAEVDRFGHAIRYAYAKDGEYSLIDEVTYAFGARGTPLYSVRFAYERRPDPITTGEPGFLLALTRRLSEVRVLSGAETIRRYLLTYEDLASSGGASRLAAVAQRGRGDAASPIVFRYQYSRSLDGTCPGACERPFVVDMGTLPAGVDLQSGRATLIDMNGDALPDIISTSLDGRHTIVPSQMDAATRVPSFGAAYPSAATTSSTAFVLNNPGVQVLDVDGDGFADMIESRNGNVLCNTGTGDWGGSACLMNSTLPELEENEVGDANPRGVRFLDYDDDRRIDMIRTTASGTEVFVNTGAAFVQRSVEDIGAVFDDSPTLQLADLNGDGLQDPVEILTSGQLRYRLNLGYGRWTAWTTVTFEGFGDGDIELLQLEDINGDGAADVVLVAGNEVRYAVNRGDHFDAAIVVRSADVTGDLPERVPDGTVVLFADMNGNGSRDIVWITGARVRFLELFPTRPNLISRVENGLGSVQQIEYGSSVLQQARDAGTADAWRDRLPYPVNVVIELDLWDRLTGSEGGGGLHERVQVSYRDGFYDGIERVFRGFARVEQLALADLVTDGQESGRTVTRYDVGADDPYRAGLLLHQASFGGEPGAWRPIRETFVTYADCPLAEVPTSGLRLPVRYVCETARQVVVQEGAPEAEWATVRVETERDGYGQVVREANLGVVHRGPPSAPRACEDCTSGACGAECTGDEQVTETAYVQPGAATAQRWILGRPVRVTVHDGAGGPRAESVTTYDGPDFVGLPEGSLERGEVTTLRTRIAEGDAWIWSTRVRRDVHGNVVERIGPRGALEVTDDFRQRFTYDEDGINLVREEMLLRDGSGRPSVLRRDTAYEPAFGLPVMQTAWVLVREGMPRTAANARRTRYDGFGRPAATLLAGDADASPSQEYTYELGDPVSRIVVRSRSRAGGPLDSEEIQCMDGLGRLIQTRTRLAEGDYQVSRRVEMNRRGLAVREYQAHRAPTGACETTVPSVPYVAYTYDAAGRPRTVSAPDDDVYGTRSFSRYEYAPLATRLFDAVDNDPASPHADTPSTRRSDGLGRLVEVTRDLGDGQLGAVRLAYDGLGRLASMIDPLGQVHAQAYDLAGRLVSATHPSIGTVAFTRDAEGNVVERRDARGRRTAAEHDALGRLLAEWDPSDADATRTTLVYDLDERCADCGHGAGELVSTTFPMGELGQGRDEIGYDARGRVVLQARTLEGHRYVTRHEYDLIGRLVRSTLPGGIELARGYDAASRPTSIEGVVDAFTYDAGGNLASVLYANGARTDRSYDGAQRLRSMETRAGGLVLQGAAYERDRVGNILELRDVSDLARQGASLDATFEYDAWYRLRSAAFAAATSGDPEVLTMSYDLGDRVRRRESSLGRASRAHVGAFEYDAAHPERVVRAGERTYAYDAAGHVQQRGATALQWDHAGRLTAAGREGAGREDARASAFFYRGADRVAKLEDGGVTFYVGPEVEVRDGIVNVYPRLGSARLARLRSASLQTAVLSDVAPLGAPEGEINAADAWIAHASQAGIVTGVEDASDPMRLLRGAARRLLALDGGDRAYLHHDHLGSITLATDARGETVGETLYYPNGEVRYRTGFTDEHGFTGQEGDASTGLIAFQHRHLDPEAGRWMSPDPAFVALSPGAVADQLVDATSLYGYVGNQTMNAIDPSGLSSAAAGGTGRGSRLQALRQRVSGAAGRVGRALGSAASSFGRGVARVGGAVGKFVRENPRTVFGAVTAGVVAAATGGLALAPIAIAVSIALAPTIAWKIVGPTVSEVLDHLMPPNPRSASTRERFANFARGAKFVGNALLVGTFALAVTALSGGGAAVGALVVLGVWGAAGAITTTNVVSYASSAVGGAGTAAQAVVSSSDHDEDRLAAQRELVAANPRTESFAL